MNLEFEVPFRELGFFGVPHRTNSFIMPTVNCLVELTELPFTVMTLGGAPRPIIAPVPVATCLLLTLLVAFALVANRSVPCRPPAVVACRGQPGEPGARRLQPAQL